MWQAEYSVSVQVRYAPFFDNAVRGRPFAAHSDLPVQRVVHQVTHRLVQVEVPDPVHPARQPQHFHRRGGKVRRQVATMLVPVTHLSDSGRLLEERTHMADLRGPGNQRSISVCDHREAFQRCLPG